MDMDEIFNRLMGSENRSSDPLLLINFRNGSFNGEWSEDAIGASQMFYGFSADAAGRIADFLENTPEWMRGNILSFKTAGLPAGIDFEPVNINPENFNGHTLRASQFSNLARNINEGGEIPGGHYYLMFYPGLKCASLVFESKHSSDAISVDFNAKELREMAAELKEIEKREAAAKRERRGPR